ncbi:MAG: HAMP domain-containing histidine kinase [Planctomycetes bacterium]|nr:HAMP domain-containing histidine kinase [Planctomycetota bacterium]
MPPNPNSLAALPGARVSCALLTVFTILLAWPNPPAALAAIVRPGYFALLFGFFWRTGRQSPGLHGLPMRLVGSGFFVLCLGYTLAGAIHFLALEPRHQAFVYLREACERGAMFLLGTTLIAYGLMLWIPHVLASHRQLGEHVQQQSGQLRLAETARSQLEARLVDADRRGLLGELAATIAHDLRNPLTIVKGTAESLCRRPRTLAELAQHTDVIRRNIDKADRTIASLIDLGRPRTTTARAQPARQALAEVRDLVQVEARRRRIQVEVEADRAATVLADPTLLAQALLNLVLNAVQASAPRSRIVLRARTVRRSGRGWTVLAVDDRGPGIAPGDRSRLFTPFFTTKPGGTGLGLSSCRRIAGELGGRLDLRPRHRGGARALLLLPAPGTDACPTPRTTEAAEPCTAPAS